MLPVAAAFLFLPQLIFGLRVGDRTPDQLFAGDRLPGDIVAIVLLIAASTLGQLVLAFVAVRDGTDGLTVGGLLQRSLGLLLPAIAASLIQGLAIGFGLLLLVVPGLWLLARLSVVLPLVATDAPDPVEALRASWRLTDGHALSILGMLLLLAFGFVLLSIGIAGLGAAIGVIGTVAAGGTPETGWGIGRWLYELVRAAMSAALGLAYITFLGRLAAALGRLPARA